MTLVNKLYVVLFMAFVLFMGLLLSILPSQASDLAVQSEANEIVFKLQ